MSTKTPKCPHCGSRAVTKDATAVWDPDEQDWVLRGLMDYTICEDCDEEINELLWDFVP